MSRCSLLSPLNGASLQHYAQVGMGIRMYVHKHAVNNLYTASLRKVKKITERYWHLSHSIHGQSQDPKNQSVPGNRYNISLRSLSSYVNLHC